MLWIDHDSKEFEIALQDAPYFLDKETVVANASRSLSDTSSLEVDEGDEVTVSFMKQREERSPLYISGLTIDKKKGE